MRAPATIATRFMAVLSSSLPHAVALVAQRDRKLDFHVARAVVGHRVVHLVQPGQQVQAVLGDEAVGLDAGLVLVEAHVGREARHADVDARKAQPVARVGLAEARLVQHVLRQLDDVHRVMMFPQGPKYIKRMDEALIRARVQFGLNIGFHILFPAITIGLAWLLVHFRIRYERTRDPAWLQTYKLWVKVFALSFAMGVVSGVVMSFQFGTNWPGYMNAVGNIAGPLLAYEVLTAFFLEATFLGVMLFGMNRVPGWVHVTSAVVVAFGTTVSAFWILALNSWMHTPTGHVEVQGEIIAGSWLEVIFNPSFPYRLTHMLLASGITAAFLVAGLSAWRLLRAPADPGASKTLRLGARLAAVLVPIQVVVGDLHGLNTLVHQPAKIAAMEALWETRKGAPLVLVAIPDEQTRANRFAVEIPRLASLILVHDADGEVRGL